MCAIFYPITHLTQVLQWVGQVFPVYWPGLGMRAALPPHSLRRMARRESGASVMASRERAMRRMG